MIVPTDGTPLLCVRKFGTNHRSRYFWTFFIIHEHLYYQIIINKLLVFYYIAITYFIYFIFT